MNDSLNQLQAIISNALTEMNEKSLITEANLARKVGISGNYSYSITEIEKERLKQKIKPVCALMI